MKNPFLALSGLGWAVTSLTHWLGQFTISDWVGFFTIAATLVSMAKDLPVAIRNWTQKRK